MSLRNIELSRLPLMLLLAAAVVSGCSRDSEPPQVKSDYVFEPVRAATVYVTLVEKPDAARVLLLGDGARALTNYFNRAGARAFVKADGGRFDILLVSCGEMTKESCAKACSLVKDNGVVAWMMNVGDVSMDSFKAMLQSFDLAETHLWMPGSDCWLLTGRRTPRQVKLSAQLELFSRDGIQADLVSAKCAGLPDVFASYVGTRNDILPAFDGAKGEAIVRPAYFLLRKTAPVGWIAAGDDVDEDIRSSVLSEIHSRQVVRRLVVEGDLLSERATDKKGEEAATEQWAKACVRNPNDLMLLERLDRLDRNARGFLEVGKVLLAMKCYETMVLVRPNDAAAIHNFGMCLKKIGKRDLAEKVLERAKSLSNGR